MFKQLASLSRTLLIATAIYLLTPLSIQAGNLGTTTPVIIAEPGTSGMFEEMISVPTGGTESTVTAFSLTLTATATTGTGLTFTGVSMATTPDAYIFAGVSSDAANSIAFSSDVFPNLSFTVSDSDTNPAGQVVSPGGAAFGLVEVMYNVAADATLGAYTLTFTENVTQTGSVVDLPFPATFTIVPEPNSGVLAGLAAAVALIVFVRGRRQSAA